MNPLPHGQVIFAILKESPCTRDELQTIFDEKYGNNVQFQLCNHPNVNTDELLSFLLKVNKIIKDGDLYRLNTENICN